MSDYIKRSELIMHLSDWAFAEAPLKDDHDQNVKYDTIQTCIEAVERMKSADVVERKKGEWDMFDLISSAYYGKGMYFKQDNGTVYSRHSGEYMTVDEAIREFISLINEENIAFVPSVTTAWTDGEASTYALQKHGKWELVGTTKLYEAGLWVDDEIEEKCSLCGCHTFRYETQTKNNFCPNCGADMREER